MLSKFVCFLFLLTFLFSPLLSHPVLADYPKHKPLSCAQPYVESAEFPDTYANKAGTSGGLQGIKVNFTGEASKTARYFIVMQSLNAGLTAKRSSDNFPLGSGNSLSFNLNEDFDIQNEFYSVRLMSSAGGTEKQICELGKIKVLPKGFQDIQCSFSVPANAKEGEPFNANVSSLSPGNGDYGLHYKLAFFDTSAKPIPKGMQSFNAGSSTSLTSDITAAAALGTYGGQLHIQDVGGANKDAPGDISVSSPKLINGKYTAVLVAYRVDRFFKDVYLYYQVCGQAKFTVSGNPTSGSVSSSATSGSKVKPEDKPGCSPGDKSCSTSRGIACDPESGDVIEEIPTKDTESVTAKGILTAIGCVPTDPLALINGLMGMAVGAGGGIALLLMIFGAFQMITSAGNPETIKKGQEQFTSAIIGLLFIIFSTLLLKIIGADILAIPGFG